MERRQHARRNVFSQVTAFAAEELKTVILMDISRSGARILLPVDARLAMSEVIALKLGTMPTIVGKVSRIQGRIAGVQFANILHPSLITSAKRLCEAGRAEGVLVIG